METTSLFFNDNDWDSPIIYNQNNKIVKRLSVGDKDMISFVILDNKIYFSEQGESHFGAIVNALCSLYGVNDYYELQSIFKRDIDEVLTNIRETMITMGGRIWLSLKLIQITDWDNSNNWNEEKIARSLGLKEFTKLGKWNNKHNGYEILKQNNLMTIISETIRNFIKENIEDKFRYFIQFISSTKPLINKPINSETFNIRDEISYNLFTKRGYRENDGCGNDYMILSPIEKTLTKISEKYNLGIDYEELFDENDDFFLESSVKHIISFINKKYLIPNGINIDEFNRLHYDYAMDEFMLFIKEEFEFNGGYIYCERGMNIDSAIKTYKNYDGVGVCWTYSKGFGTSEYAGEDGEEIVLIGSVPLSSIDWRHTFYLYRIGSHEMGEREVRLKNNAPIYLSSIIEKNSGEKYTFPSPIIVSSGSYY